MKSQSASGTPGSVTVPRSVVQVPMTDAEPTDMGEVSVSVSMLLSKEAVLTNSPTQRPQSEGIQSVSSKKSTYGLSENEKVLSAIVRWGEYASMKVRHGAFGDPLFMEMLQAACGPHDTKGLVPKLTRRSFKGFMIAEFQVTSPSSICYHMLLIHTY